MLGHEMEAHPVASKEPALAEQLQFERCGRWTEVHPYKMAVTANLRSHNGGTNPRTVDAAERYVLRWNKHMRRFVGTIVTVIGKNSFCAGKQDCAILTRDTSDATKS